MLANGFEGIREGKLSEQIEEDAIYISGSPNRSAANDVHAIQYHKEGYVTLWGYHDIVADNPSLPISVRDIYMRDSLATLFAKLGFANGGEISAISIASPVRNIPRTLPPLAKGVAVEV